jgi:hypothetical protein
MGRGKKDMEYIFHIPSEFHKYTRCTFSKHVTADMPQTKTPDLGLQILVIMLWSGDS